MILRTDRLILRPFEPADLAAFSAINADRRVMRYFPAPYSAEQTATMLDIWAKKTARVGYGWSAVERTEDRALLGMAGLSRLEDATISLAPCTEIGWRLTPDGWGKGYATEAARAWLGHGFDSLRLAEIVSFAPRLNLPSHRVMQRIGMARAKDLDFAHPAIPDGHELRQMSVYRMRQPDWAEA